MLVSVVLLCWMYSSVSFLEILTVIDTIPAQNIIAAFLLNITGVVLVNVIQVYFHALKSGREGGALEFWFLIRTDLVFRFFSLILPLVGSAALKLLRYKSRGYGASLSLDMVLLNKLIQLLVITCVASSIVWVHYLFGLLDLSLLLVWALVLISIFMLVAYGLYVAFGMRVLAGVIRFIGKNIPFGQQRIVGFAHQVENGVVRRGKWEIISFSFVCGLLQFFSVLIVALSQYILYPNLGIDLDYTASLVVRCLVMAAMLIPISYAGMGFREVSTVGVLAIYGIAIDESMVLATLLLVFQLSISLLGFLVFFFERFSSVGQNANGSPSEQE